MYMHGRLRDVRRVCDSGGETVIYVFIHDVCLRIVLEKRSEGGGGKEIRCSSYEGDMRASCDAGPQRFSRRIYCFDLLFLFEAKKKVKYRSR